MSSNSGGLFSDISSKATTSSSINFQLDGILALVSINHCLAILSGLF